MKFEINKSVHEPDNFVLKGFLIQPILVELKKNPTHLDQARLVSWTAFFN